MCVCVLACSFGLLFACRLLVFSSFASPPLFPLFRSLSLSLSLPRSLSLFPSFSQSLALPSPACLRVQLSVPTRVRPKKLGTNLAPGYFLCFLDSQELPGRTIPSPVRLLCATKGLPSSLPLPLFPHACTLWTGTATGISEGACSGLT